MALPRLVTTLDAESHPLVAQDGFTVSHGARPIATYENMLRYNRGSSLRDKRSLVSGSNRLMSMYNTQTAYFNLINMKGVENSNKMTAVANKLQTLTQQTLLSKCAITEPSSIALRSALPDMLPTLDNISINV